MKRRLTADELAFCMKNAKRLEDEILYNKYQLKYCDLMLYEGLMVNHLKHIRDFKQNRKEFEQELAIAEASVKTLREQTKHGVEVKEKNEIEDEGEEEGEEGKDEGNIEKEDSADGQ